MKILSFIMLGILMMFVVGFQPGERKLRKVQKEKEMLEMLESGEFRFVARSAHSSLGNFNNLSTHYDIVFDSMRIKAFLPYYGRAYSAPYNEEGGVKFDLKADKIEKRWDKKKKRYIVATEVSDQRDSYSIYMTASLSGYADVVINFRNRQMISYYGTLERLKDK